MTFDHGWDRYIDNHIGWYVPVAENIDGDDDGVYYEKYKLDKLGEKFKNGKVRCQRRVDI